MYLRGDGWYNADAGKYFVLTEKGKEECASYADKTVGEPVDVCEYEAPRLMVLKEYVEEVDIPGWTKLKGYQVVYYHNGYRLTAGNTATFPTLKMAKVYKKNYEAHPWFDNKLLIEEVDYEGIPLSESKIYNGKEVIDEVHYFGLDACEIGDYFTEDVVMDFMDALPPTTFRNDCSQIGEPTTQRIDDNGKCRNTYETFKKIADGIWEYCGDCFRGENVKRGKELAYV